MTRKKVQTAVGITIENKEKLDQYRDQHGASITWIINKALEKYFEDIGFEG